MTQPTAGDVHVNTPLSNISIAYVQDASAFVADQIFPNIPVAKQSDRYYTYDRGQFNRDEMEIRAPGTESAGSGYTVDNTPTYFTPVRAFHHDIPDEVRANQDSVINADRDATILVTTKGLISREKTWVGKYFAAGLWTTTIDGVAAAPGAGEVLQWNDASSTPIEDVRAGVTTVLESTGFMPNTLVIGHQVWDALQDHPDIIDRLKYGQTAGGAVEPGRAPAMVNVTDLQALFKLPRIFIMSSIENTAAEGVTNVHAFIGGKKALLCYSTPTPGIMIPTAGYTFSWNGLLGASALGSRIKRFRMDKLNSDRVEIDMSFDQKLVSADLGYFFDTIVA